MPEIKIPYAWEPAELTGGEHAIEVLAHPARMKVINWHRKARKSLMGLNKLVSEAATTVGTYGYIGPTQKLALDILWNDPQMCARNIPPEIWDRRNKTEKFIPFPNGSLLYVRGADSPDNLRGPNWRGVVLDEYAFMRPVTYDIIKPAIANNQGFVWFISTPNGNNDFKAKADYARTANDQNWAYFELKASQSGILTLEQLVEEKRSMPRAFYDQEFECCFTSNALRVFPDPKKLMKNVGLPVKLSRYQVGWDLAKSVDFTVGYAVDLTKKPYQVYLLDRWQGADWNLTKARIESFYFRLGRPKGFIDSTGVGDPILDDLSRTCGRLEGYKFTQDSRKKLFDNLIIQMEQENISLPYDEGLATELDAFRFIEQNSGGRKWFRAEAPSSMTDDRVCALALACWDLPARPLSPLPEPRHQQPEKFDKFALI